MAEMQDSWKQVAGKAEALGLKLKLHLEQEQDDEHEARDEGDTKALVDELGRKLTDAFDSFGSAAKDPAVHEDFKDIGRLIKDALVTTFNAVGEEASSRTNSSGSSSEATVPSDETPQDAGADELVEDDHAGDETDDGDA
jgi:hypothetical protein